MNKMIVCRHLAFEAIGFIILCTTLPTWCQKLIVSPRGSLFKDLDSRTILSCSFIDYDPAQYSDLDLRWIGPDMQHIKDRQGRIHVEQYDPNTVKLYINGVKEADAGVYSCQLDANRQLFTEAVQLSLHEGIRFEDNPVSYQAKAGEQSVLLLCAAFGLPLPEISWRFSKVKVPEVSEKYVYEKNGLRIKDVELSDNGTYECRAEIESQGSLKVRNINLDVLYPPIITEHPSIVDRVIKGQDAVLQCAADGNPPVRYDWLLEKRMSDLVKAKVPVQKGSQTLRIRNIDSDDEGRYFCRASNSVGMQESYVDLTMLVPPVVKELGERVTVEGRTLILPCELITGRPSPELFWYSPTGQRFTEETQTDDEANVSVDNTHRGVSKLIIRNIQRSQSGDYVCEAVNSVGNASKVAVINVDYVPQMISSATKVFGWSGQVRNLTCIADGQPLPVVSWFSRGQHVFESLTHRLVTATTRNVTTSTLQITIGDKQPWVFSSYTCIAKNSHGSTSATVELREAELPDLPHNVTVLEVRDTETTLIVTPPMKTGGIPLTSWTVKYEPVEMGAKEKTIFFDSEPDESLATLKVTDLLPDTEYTFHLAAGNDVGFGKPIKFLVKTYQKSVFKEQSDVPQKSDTGSRENIWKDPAALEKIGLDGSDSDGQNSSVGVILGILSALAILVLLSAGTAFGVRRLRSEGRLKNLVRFPWAKDEVRLQATKGEEAEKVLQMVEVVHPSEVLPGVDNERAEGRGNFVKGITSIPRGTGLSSKPGQVCSPLTSVRSLTLTPNSIRNFSWEHHALETREFNDEDLSSGFGTADQPELSLMSDIPPQVHDEVESRADQPSLVRDPDEDSILDVNLDEEDSK